MSRDLSARQRRSLRLALGQVNPTVGDLAGNAALVTDVIALAEVAGASVVVFPELVVTGYPPEDLLLRKAFVLDNLSALDEIAASTDLIAAVVGFVDQDGESGRLYNAAAVCAHGQVVGTYRKRLLPNYAVFDEQRYFAARATPPTLFSVAGVTVGVSICEDAWDPSGPITEAASGGAEVVFNINASPYSEGRSLEREAMLCERARAARVPIVYVNQVGGQDELVFDGGSLVVGADGSVLARAQAFREDFVLVEVEVDPRPDPPSLDVVEANSPRQSSIDRWEMPPSVEPLGEVEEVYEALVLGTRDYAIKNGFTDAVVGLSGGVDSSLVACIAAEALGSAHVRGVAMPSRHSTGSSITDAEVLAANLGIELSVMPIEGAHLAMRDVLAPAGIGEGLADENLQGRLRAAILWSLANHHPGLLVLVCGNKSELAVGYTTAYGVDMAGGFAVIKDVLKTLVYQLCEDRNKRAGRDLIPRSVLDKAPSAELRPGQRDDDVLPPYSVLDPVIAGYVGGDLTSGELIEAGHSPEVVVLVTALVDRAEWKRRQSPPGVRVSAKAFGKDRRMPITNRYPG